MAKKQIDDKIQAKFDKPQFSLEDAVYFSFLGQKQYGYVTKIKKASWGIQYNIQSATGTRYPCGICIKGIKTTYDIGIIYFEESKQIGTDECRRRYDAARSNRPVAAVFTNPKRTTNESRDGDQTSKSDADNAVGKMDDNSRTRNRTKNDDKSSATGTSPGNRKKRGNSKNVELDDAIQKQRNFLNGFVKKD